MNTFQLVCVRHGESAWNKDNRFCGWVDVSLSENGIQEAHQAGKAIKNEVLIFDTVFTSTLKRAVTTANIILSHGIDQPKTPLIQNWQLNERHYGALTGLNKAEMAEIHGKEQVQIWRRSFDVRPPPMDSNHPCYYGKNEHSLELARPDILPQFFLTGCCFLERIETQNLGKAQALGPC